VDDRAQVQLLRRDHREAVAQIEAHLMAEDGDGPRSGSIVLADALVHDAA
jgi:hypothetical protein